MDSKMTTWEEWEEEAIQSIRKHGSYFCNEVDEFIGSAEEIIHRLVKTEKELRMLRAGLSWILIYYGDEIELEIPSELVEKVTGKKSDIGIYTRWDDREDNFKVTATLTYRDDEEEE